MPGSSGQISRNSEAAATGKRPAQCTDWIWWAGLTATVLVNLVVAAMFLPSSTPKITVPHSVFKNQVAQGNVARITAQGDTITGAFKSAVTYTPADSSQKTETGTQSTTVSPAFPAASLEALLDQEGVEVSATSVSSSTSMWAGIVLGFGPVILILAAFWWLSRGAMSRAGARTPAAITRSYPSGQDEDHPREAGPKRRSSTHFITTSPRRWNQDTDEERAMFLLPHPLGHAHSRQAEIPPMSPVPSIGRATPLVVIGAADATFVGPLAEQIESAGSFVYVTHGPHACLRVATALGPDRVVLDPRLPRSLARLLRAHPRTEHAQVTWAEETQPPLAQAAA